MELIKWKSLGLIGYRSLYSLKSSRQTSILTRKLEDLDYLNANCFIDGRINTKI